MTHQIPLAGHAHENNLTRPASLLHDHHQEAAAGQDALSHLFFLATGSITGYHASPHPLGYGYLTATERGMAAAAAAGGSSHRRQPFCGNREGWGPLSPYRYDFTPCFMDVGVSLVAVFGLVGGALAIWWLRRFKPKTADVQGHGRGGRFWFKMAVLGAIVGCTAAQVVVQMLSYPDIFAGDFRFWTTVLTSLSLVVVGCIQWLEYTRLRNPNGVVLFYWLLLLIAYTIKLRSLISQQIYNAHVPYFALFCAAYGLSWVEFGMEWLVPRKRSAYEAIAEEDECPIEYATVFSILTFSWMTPLMKYGYSKFLNEDDLWNLAKRDTTKVTGDAFREAWEHEVQNRKKPNLWIALFRSFGGPYFRGSLFKIVSDILHFVQPQLLRLLIQWVASYKTDTPQPAVRGAAIAVAMFATSVGQTTALHQYFQRSFETGMRIKTALTASIYEKSLKLSNEGRASKTTGDIVNYMAVDTQRLQDLTQYAQNLWSAPFQIALCLASLYQLVGVSFMAGLGAMILMIPVNGFIAKVMKSLQKEQMKNKDSRTRLIGEVINNMKSIKLYAWGSAFMARLNYVRNDQELKTLRKIGATQAIANFTWSSTPFLVSCSTFAVFVLTEKIPLTTDIVFPALTLFNILTFPLAVLPMVITAVVEASVAVGRLTSFLAAEEIQANATNAKGPVDHVGDEALSIKDGTFSWDRYGNRNALEDINFTAAKGELTCIVGRVGSGKSSFLQALLGDIWKVKGEVTVHGSVAYVAQSSWVMNASVKDNILFGHRFDADFYNKTVHACALLDDFSQLPHGDDTEVGERGISLSGGQKARLTLARAVYARADIYLLDDCLSAVDQHVGRHLIENVFGSNGLLKSKARVLATNSIPVLADAELVYLVREGRIIEKGNYAQLVAMKGEIASLIKTANNQDQNDEPGDASTPSSEPSSGSSTMIERGTQDDEEKDQIEEAQDDITQLQAIKPGGSGVTKRKKSSGTLRRASAASFHGARSKVVDEEAEARNKGQGKEHMEQGKVKWNVYAEYAKTSNLLAVLIYLLMLVGSQTTQVAGNVWLKDWAEINQKMKANPRIAFYLGIYFALGIGSAALVVVYTLILWIFCSIEASRKLHERMAFSIFRSPMSFFETTPAGRVLNRFSSDIYRIDEVLARTFNMLFVNSARALFTLVVISFSTPAFIALILPLAGVYYIVQRYYLRTSRELKRLDSVTKSPIYAHFQETLGGITTIRAYRQQQRFATDNEWKVDANLRAYFPSINANRWLAVRLEFLGSLIILASAGFAIVAVAGGSKIGPGIVGLSLSYALQITQSLNWIVRQTVEVETNIVSVERVLEYAALPSEAPEVIHRHRPPIAWPAKGAVTFSNYSTRYRPGLDLVLKDISLDIKPREKIGVVGRTGAGKSSLTLALFRIIEAAEGNINIDGLSTSTIGLLDLRRRLAIIPQDAALFEGTVRENLDPGTVHDDTELWSVLEHARLKDHIATMDGGLDAKIHEGGSNLSQGQRQLLSLARALLTPSNILVLDEATSAIDIETDARLQATLRSPLFAQRTIITIAHRINTILDSDRVVVLERGRVVECGAPKDLMAVRGGQGAFAKLVREAGLEGSFGAGAPGGG